MPRPDNPARWKSTIAVSKPFRDAVRVASQLSGMTGPEFCDRVLAEAVRAYTRRLLAAGPVPGSDTEVRKAQKLRRSLAAKKA